MILLTIRLATLQDIPAIASIYHEFINTTVTMDTEKDTIQSRTSWFQNHSPEYPIICFTTESNLIAGWASLSKWSPKPGYKLTVENSVYVSKKFQHLGIGKNHSIIARIDSENTISLELHKKFGFVEIGYMKEFGFKFNKFVDIIMLQLIL